MLNLYALEVFFEQATQQLGIVVKLFCDFYKHRPSFSGVKKNFSYTEILPKRAWLESTITIVKLK